MNLIQIGLVENYTTIYAFKNSKNQILNFLVKKASICSYVVLRLAGTKFENKEPI